MSGGLPNGQDLCKLSEGSIVRMALNDSGELGVKDKFLDAFRGQKIYPLHSSSVHRRLTRPNIGKSMVRPCHNRSINPKFSTK